MELPPLNQRVRELINEFTMGNVSKFSDSIGHSPQKINRLFSIDSRSGKYPEPSLDIVNSITNKYSTIEPRWLNNGQGAKYRIVENNANTISGEADQRHMRIQFLEAKIEELKERIEELKKENKELTEIAAVLRYQLEKEPKN